MGKTDGGVQPDLKKARVSACSYSWRFTLVPAWELPWSCFSLILGTGTAAHEGLKSVPECKLGLERGHFWRRGCCTLCSCKASLNTLLSSASHSSASAEDRHSLCNLHQFNENMKVIEINLGAGVPTCVSFHFYQLVVDPILSSKILAQRKSK